MLPKITILILFTTSILFAGGLESKKKSNEELNKIFNSAQFIIKGEELVRRKVGYTFAGQIVSLEEGKKRMREQTGAEKHVLLTRYQVRIKLDKVIMGDMSTLKPHLRNEASEVTLEWSDLEGVDCTHIPDKKEFNKGIWCWMNPTDEHGLCRTEWLLLTTEKELTKLTKIKMQNKAQ